MKIFGIDKSFGEAVNRTFADVISILVASALGASLTWLSFEEDAWLPMWAYLAALVMMVIGLWVSKNKRSRLVSYIINLMIVASMCTVVTVLTTQCLAHFLSSQEYGWANDSKFVNKYPHFSNSYRDLAMMIGVGFCVILLNRWMDLRAVHANVKNTYQKTILMDQTCRILLAMLDSKLSLLALLTVVGVSFYLGQTKEDMSIFAASGAWLTVFGLFSIIRFTTIEKHLKQADIIALSGGVTGPPVSEEKAKEIEAENMCAAGNRLRQELRSEIIGVFLTVVGTVIWAYGGYLPSTYL